MTNKPAPVRDDAVNCFVCGPANPIGLKLRFTIAGNVCRGEFTSNVHHVGFDGITHGGIIFSVLDDAMANWFYLQGARGYTAKCAIRFRAAMAVGATAVIACELLKRKGRLLQLKACATDKASGGVIAEAEASFMLEDAGRLPPV